MPTRPSPLERREAFKEARRAKAMPALERRDAIIAATVPLLREHGRDITSRQIAEAAGVAEGTIFRVFTTKEDVIEAAIVKAFDPSDFLDDLAAINPDQPLRDRLVDVVTVTQRRFFSIFALMGRLGLYGPPRSADDPRHKGPGRDWLARAHELTAQALGDLSEVRVDGETLSLYLRLLTMSGSNSHMTEGHLLTPTEIVDLVLDGVRKEF